MIKSKITSARPGTESIRTTIPKSVKDALGLKSKDTIIWEIIIKDNQLVAIIKKEEK